MPYLGMIPSAPARSQLFGSMTAKPIGYSLPCLKRSPPFFSIERVKACDQHHFERFENSSRNVRGARHKPASTPASAEGNPALR